MPHFATFRSAHGFYGTHIHECAHASGAAHRLDRDFSARWTKDALAMEEATAELTASFLLAHLGIADDPPPAPASCLASPLPVTTPDSRASLSAASQSKSAADWAPPPPPREPH